MKRIFEPIRYQLDNFPQSDALANKVNGNWVNYSTQQVCDISEQLSVGLLSKKIQPKDKVGIISFNRPEWVLTDLAISQIGAISVPMYPNSTSEDYEYIINDSKLKLLFVGDAEILEKINKATQSMESKPIVYSFDQLKGAEHWKNLQLQVLPEHKTQLTDIQQDTDENDLATIIYTSGTTGNPKGVMLSHKNIMSNADAVSKVFGDINSQHRSISFLPLCHIFERTGLYVYQQLGVSVYYAQSMDTLGDDIRAVQPHVFATVPRLLEKVYEKIMAKGNELTGLKKGLFFWAVKLGQQYSLDRDQGALYNFKLSLANKLIFSKWREALGGNIKFIISGAAALQQRLSTIFWSAEIPILEAYGLTETSPGVSFSTKSRTKVGCVGPLLENVQVKFEEDGEILVKSPGVMQGYYNKPEATAEVIDADGWFRTGDIGMLVDNEFLKITDRKKEMFKTSGGKYIAPQVLENKFKESRIIEQIMVIGESRKFPSALIVPSFENLREWCSIHSISYTDDKEMIKNDKVLQKFEKEVSKYNQEFARYEQVKKFELLPDQWTIEGTELTPTLKLKRKNIKAKYASVIEIIYSN